MFSTIKNNDKYFTEFKKVVDNISISNTPQVGGGKGVVGRIFGGVLKVTGIILIELPSTLLSAAF